MVVQSTNKGLNENPSLDTQGQIVRGERKVNSMKSVIKGGNFYNKAKKMLAH